MTKDSKRDSCRKEVIKSEVIEMQIISGRDSINISIQNWLSISYSFFI